MTVSASLRARDLIAQLLAFSRQSEMPLGTIDFVPMIKETLHFLRAVTPANVKMTTVLHEGDFTLVGHPSQIHQILMNLCTNAIHAVHKRDGGKVEITLEETVLPDWEAQSLTLSPGRHALLMVRDNGEGISARHLERIFDPFFTTKAVGEGTGLGLSVVHGHVSALKGRILVESRVGSGSTFRVYLPLGKADGARENAPHLEDESVTFGLRVLLVDDEPQLKRVLMEHLAALGCQTESASNVTEGVALLTANPDGFDLVITDQTMPDATGEQLLGALRHLELNLPVVLTSGYKLPFPAKELRARGFFAFLPKPVLALELAQILRRLSLPSHPSSR
ncbi:MAG: response regulator [Magnetococcales bacterium]|nr:response regulator [Magnetococcales bacterium]